MIDALRPWFSCAFGTVLMLQGYRYLRHPDRFVGAGIIPVTVPRIIRFLGVVGLIIGAATIATYLPRIIPE